MRYNFDKHIERSNTASIKHDLKDIIFGTKDVIPFWVADMDFETPDFIRESVIKRAMHPVYGYTFRDDAYYQSIIGWMNRRYQWEIEKDWILFSPGVVPALNMAILAFSNPGDEIIVQPPVYFPFFSAVKDHNRTLVYNQLIKRDADYGIDFDLFEKQAQTAKLFVLSNPHNPVGRCWNAEELNKLATICLKNNVLVLSDEIHSDLVLPPNKHHVFAALSKEISEITVTLHAPSKTFNLAGLSSSSVIIENPELRKKMKTVLQSMHIEMGNIFGIEATKAAFNYGEPWLEQLLKYIQLNVNETVSFLNKNLPEVNIFVPEATYMIWLDFSFTGLLDEELRNKMIHEAGLGLSPGKDFGPGGSQMMRLNVACPKEILMKGLEQMASVFRKK